MKGSPTPIDHGPAAARSSTSTSHDASARTRALQAVAVFGALFLCVAAYLVGWEADPEVAWPETRWTAKEVNRGFFYAAATAAALVSAYFVVARRLRATGSRGRRFVVGVGCAAVLFSGLFYFMGVHGLRNANYSHRWDSFHYLLGPKYYDEIDYFDLYRCTAQAATKIPGSKKTKFLETYEHTTVAQLRRQADCREQFTDERWDEFKRDLAVYGEATNYRALGRMLHDLGYNGTPTHSVVAGFVANQFEVSERSLVLVSLFDVAFICAAMTTVVWAFGWRLGLAFALFYFVGAIDRFSVDGGSFFRHAWSATLIAGIASLKRERHGAAGFLLTVSSSMNVFPVVFVAGVGLKYVVDWVRQRRFPARATGFVKGALLASVLFGGAGMLSERGAGAYASFFENMETHDVRGRFPGFGVGLKFNFVEYGADRAKAGTGAKRKAKSFEKQRRVYQLTALALIALAGWVAARLDDAAAAVVFGLTVMYAQLETTGYYFAIVALWVLAWAGRLGRAGPAAMLLALFAVNVWWMRSLHEDSIYYLFNVSVSLWLGFYMLAALVVLGLDSGAFRSLQRCLSGGRASAARDGQGISGRFDEQGNAVQR